jgi:hypothetical protein
VTGIEVNPLTGGIISCGMSGVKHWEWNRKIREAVWTPGPDMPSSTAATANVYGLALRWAPVSVVYEKVECVAASTRNFGVGLVSTGLNG